MGEEPKTTRRDFLKLAGTGLACLVIGGVAGYLAGSRKKPPAPAPAPTVTVTVTKTAPAPAPTPTATPAIPREPLKIGGMWFMTGKFGTYGDMAKKGLEIALEEINAAGGILGREVQYVIRDEAEREQVLTNIRDMVERDKVEFLVGIDSSGDSLKIAPVIEDELHVPFIVTHAATPKLTECKKRKYVFRVSMYEEPIDLAAAKLVAERYPDAKRIANIGPDYAYGYDSWKAFSTYLKKFKPDVELLEPVYPKLGTPDFGSYIDQLIAMEPDVVFSSLWGGDAATFIKQAVYKGFFKKVKVYLNAMLGATDTLKAIGSDVPKEAEVWGSGRYWFEYPPHDVYTPNKLFVEKFKKRYGEYPAYVAATSYTALYAIKHAIEKAYLLKGAWPTTEEIISALEGLTVPAPMGPVYIRPEDHQGVYEVFWGKLTLDPAYPHPVLKDLVIFGPGEVFPPPLTTVVEC